MTSYKDLFKLTDDPLIPPNDTLNEAVYKNSKIDYIFRGTTSSNLDEDVDMKVKNSNSIIPAIPDNSSKETFKASQGSSLVKYDQDKHETPRPSENSKWKLLRVIAGAHQGWIRSVIPDPVTNEWFVTGSSDSTIKVWDLASLKLKATITGHIMGVRALAVSSRYPYLFSGSEDKTVRCWDLERTNHPSGCQIRNYHGHVGGIYAMALHPELDLLFTGGRDQVIRVWDIRSRTQVMVLTGHSSDISSIVSQGGDPQIVSSSMDSTIRLWDIRKQSTALALTHHSKSIRLMVLHPEEMTFCSGDSSGSIKEWLLPGGELLNDYGSKTSESNIINSLAIEPTTNTLFSGYDDGKMEFYDYVSGKLLQSDHSTPVPGADNSAIYASTFDMSGLRLICGEGDKSVKIWGQDL